MSNNYWTDWQQNKRIDEAEEQLAAERRARSRLAEQLRRQQGDLQGQIDRLTRAFVALVEHEDIRAELGQHADAAALRRYAREVVATVIVTGGAALRGVAEPDDVPGYWLAAAARGVAASARGEAGADELLAEARRRDPVRTAVFGCLLAAQTRDPRWAPPSLAEVLPSGALVTTAQRRVWLAVAEGRLAPPTLDAPAELVAALRRIVEADPGTPERVASWLSARATGRSSALEAEKAAADLAALRLVLTPQSPAPPRAEPGQAATPGRAGAAVPEAASMVASILGADPDPHPVPVVDPADLEPEDPEADCLRSLVDEGSPGEGDILQRMAVVRAEMGFLDERAAAMTPAFSEPAGDVLDLLLADLAAGPGAAVADLALRVLSPVLAGVAEELGRRAAAPAAAVRDVTTTGVLIPVGTAGATTEWRTPVTEAVLRRHPLDPRLQPVAIGAVALGVVLIALGFAVPALTWLGVLVLLGGGGLLGWVLWRRHARSKDLAGALGSAERQVERTRDQLLDEHSRSTAAAGAAQADLGVVRQRLGAVTG